MFVYVARNHTFTLLELHAHTFISHAFHSYLWYSMYMDSEVRGIAERRMPGGEMLSILAVGWQTSAVRGKEAGCFCDVAGVSIIVAGGPHL